MNTQIKFTRVNNDINGNPRYVCHYSNLLASSYTPEGIYITIDQQYKRALFLAKKIGGRKFHNKQYGGGIVFQSYNIEETEKAILALL
jgi:hypothetical protein